MKRERVRSRAIVGVGYDRATNVLEIEFAGDGGIYQYFAVPPSVAAALLTAESAGRFVNEQIKPRYRAVWVE
ncbi:KTSC domain-containing protein [Nakamurella lactea]|uniref:KTSC domain-containing protein n=1 Tax=Nakamurella lactea TaxID=459515 RepID=UPI0003F63E72|nr:KTSC domain-containing protein [Nakamurella lactea]